ncbi:sulfatase [Cryptosporangium sp. NPDC048952]|uniref:sulfatase n=1 Tax=Cryptosporangium sp. NPDC048952 TaxID=3363961 RepID=UPI0037169BAE
MALLTGTQEPSTDDGDLTPIAPSSEKPRSRVRTVLRWTLTALALVLVYLVLLLPNREYLLTTKAFMRIPVEAVVGAAVLLVLPGRTRKIVATLAGVVLGVLTFIKVLDMGFFAVLSRPFNVIFDWSFLGNGYDFVEGSYGKAAAVGAMVGAAVALIALLTLIVLAVRRLSQALVDAQPHATKAVAALTVIWFFCAAFGYTVPGLPQTSYTTSLFGYNMFRKVPHALADHKEFEKELAVDKFKGQNQLLAGLEGKDVIFTFIESYGRSAVEDPTYASQVDAVLDQGSAKLKTAGLTARSGWLTSPTIGGGSWLAHSTFYSGLWINNEARYRSLTKSDRLTLTQAFKKSDWRSVGVMPGLTGYWPEGEFFGYDKIYDSRNLGFKGPKPQWSAIPDQYLLSKLQRAELSKAGDTPVVAEVETTSSHAPWSYLPKLADWDQVGDGKATYGGRPHSTKKPDEVRTQYRKTIEYSLQTLTGYAEKYLGDDQVLVFLGDHQPVPLIVGQNASWDVPITIVAKDPKVMERINTWGWTDGIKPAKNAPVWKMDAFRDKFLTAFNQ